MRKVNFKRVLDALSVSSSLGNTNSSGTNANSSGSPNQGKNENEILESLTPDNFQICKIVRHGFPHRPTVLAYDPVQRLLAVGTRTGTIRIFGQPGVDIFMSHGGEHEVTQLLFLVNEGGLISVCANNTIHLWNLRQKRPAILHSLEFNIKEKITRCHLPYASKWLYIGTERGNIHMCSVETFQLSGYTINWNKAINLSQTTHPGYIVGISENPWDENKMLIGFESGLVVLWDLKTKEPEHRYHSHSALRHITWHQEGKQFMCAHHDGSINVWNYRNDVKPQQTQYPHGRSSGDKKTHFRAIDKVEWSTVRNSDAFVVFAGGLPISNQPPRPSITVMKGKSITVLEMDYNVIDFVTVCATPWSCDFQDPTSLVILLENDLVVVDLSAIGYPCIEVPHTLDLHDSPVTTLHCVKDRNSDLTPGLYQVSGNKPRRANCSKMAWPLDGGEWSVDHCTGFPEVIVTGHADGSIRFWDASAVSLKALYKLRTYKLFKRHHKQSESQDTANVPVEDDPFAICNICVCAESRSMVACNVSGTVMMFLFDKLETNVEIKTLDVNPVEEIIEGIESPTIDQSTVTESKLSRQSSDSQTAINNNYMHQNLTKSNSEDGTNLNSSENPEEVFSQYLPLLRVKAGVVKQSPGFKAELVIQFTGNETEPTPNITFVNANSAHGLIVIGTTKSVVIVDTVQYCVLMNMTSSDLLSSIDHKKCIKSPTRPKTPASFSDFSQIAAYNNDTGLKSPTNDAPNGTSHTPVHREISSSSTSSNPAKSSKRPPHTRMFKKTGSFNNNERSIESQNSITTEDSEFSRASSISDLDRSDSRDIISSLTFANIYASKGDNCTSHSLLVGTTTGYLFNIVINLPSGDQRSVQPVMASPSGNICQLNGSIINCSFLDSTGGLIEQERGYWNDRRKTMTQESCDSPSNESADKQYMVITSEKQIKVFVLPSYTQHASFTVQHDNTYMTCAGVATVQASSCLLTFTSVGNITVFSLPSLTPLHDVTYLPPLDVRVAQTLCVTDEAQVFYMPSPTEIQRLSCSVELFESVQDIVGNLFLPCTSPERPNPGFFKGLFGGASHLDREELFGEASGRPSRAVARHVPGPGANLEGLRGASQGAMSDMQRAKLLALERGEKLGELEEKTQRMHESASKFASDASRLAEKYKNKKWYQL